LGCPKTRGAETPWNAKGQSEAVTPAPKWISKVGMFDKTMAMGKKGHVLSTSLSWKREGMHFGFLVILLTPWLYLTDFISGEMTARERRTLCLIPAREPAGYSEAMATNNLFKGLPHLLAAEGIYQRIDHRITHDEYEVHVEVRHKAGAIDVLGA
jgi:hypothetical protein